VEQFYRDNRLNPIHEGTHGIQALDLLGRKVVADGGAAFYRGKLAACRYFFRWELPRTEPQLKLLDGLDGTCFEMKPEWF
jgi:hypothetical protein